MLRDEAKPIVAFLSPWVVVPPSDGGEQVIMNRVQCFAEHCSVIFVMADSENILEDEKNARQCLPNALDIVAVERPVHRMQKSSMFQKLQEGVKWFLSGKPRMAQKVANRGIRQRITSFLLEKHVDVVVNEFPYASELVDLNKLRAKGVRIVTVEHGVEHLFMADVFPIPILRTLEKIRTKAYELSVLQSSNTVIGIAPWDVEYLHDQCDVCNVEYLPPVMKRQIMQWQGKVDSKYITFCGSMSFYPNYHAMKWFIGNVLIKYVKVYPDMELRITGKADVEICRELEALCPGHVNFTGFLSDAQLRETIQEALFTVVPIIKGSGIKIKLLEALSYGVPAITTLHGQQGVPYNGEVPYLVGKGEDDFLQQMISLTEKPDLREALSVRGRSFFEEVYASERHIMAWIEAVIRKNR